MAGKVTTPSELDVPAFLMSFPFTVDNRVANNPLMVPFAPPYDQGRACRQWMGLYNALAAEALVYVMPHHGSDFQDLPFVANLGAVLPHRPVPTVMLADFMSPSRRGEEDVGYEMFRSLGYDIRQPSRFFEGEADLKFIRGNLYVGGHGIRTKREAYGWMAEIFGMDIVPVRMTDERLYHFDCLFFPIDPEAALVATSRLDAADVRAIEKHVRIIDVPEAFVYDGWTNAIRVNRRIVIDAPAGKESRNAFERVICGLGFEPVMLDLSEFAKSGADASCLVCHLNFAGRR